MEEAGFHFEQNQINSRRRQRKFRPLIGLLIAVFLLAAAGLFAVNWYFNSQKESEKKAVITPTPTEMPTPTFEPTATPDAQLSPTGRAVRQPTPTQTAVKPTDSSGRRAVTITVLNGSGTAGVASTMADYLKGLGYTVSGTGNADNYEYQNIVIQLKPAAAKYLTILKSDLSSKYTVGSTSATLSTGSTDAVIIVGK